MVHTTAVMVPFPPQISINEQPSGQHDRLSGTAVTFYNWVVLSLRLNVSVRAVDSLGHCGLDPLSGNETCTGAAQALADGSADFSLIPMSPTSYDPRLQHIPVIIGPKMFDSDMIFSSTPFRFAGNSSVTVMETLWRSPTFPLMQLLCYLLCLALINYCPVTRGSCRRLRRVLLLDMWRLSLLRPKDLSGKNTRRCVLYLSCLCLSIFGYQWLLGSTKSDLVVIQPPDYYVSLADVANSNSTVTLIAGLTVDEELRKAKEREKREVRSRAIARGTMYPSNRTDVFAKLAEQVTKTVQLYDSQFEGLCVVGLSCYLNEYTPPANVRFSSPFGSTAGVIAFSQHVSPPVRKRLHTVYSLLMDNGIYMKYNSDVRDSLKSIADPDSLTLCMQRMMHEDRQETQIPPTSLRYYTDLLLTTCTMLAAAALVVCLEILLSSRGKRRKPRWRRAHVVTIDLRQPAASTLAIRKRVSLNKRTCH